MTQHLSNEADLDLSVVKFSKLSYENNQCTDEGSCDAAVFYMQHSRRCSLGAD